MITLAGRAFAGPYMLPLWSAPRTAGVYAVMVPGWRPLTFRALYFDHAEALSADTIKLHPRHAAWVSIGGTAWNLYLAVLEMPYSTEAERRSALREVERRYRPEFQKLREPC
ncbi:MAG: hypothetical protein ACT4P4_17165 [Betaproteobacteria bacterium]